MRRSSVEIKEALAKAEKRLEDLEDEIAQLQGQLETAYAYEARMREIAEWEAEYVLQIRSEKGSVVLRATWWRTGPDGRIRRCYVGAGIRIEPKPATARYTVDLDGSVTDIGVTCELLAVYELTDYRERSMSLVYGQRPPVDIEMEIMRRFKVKREK